MYDNKHSYQEEEAHFLPRPKKCTQCGSQVYSLGRCDGCDHPEDIRDLAAEEELPF